VDERKILAGRYELGETIGRGGMAEVHIGHDRRLGRTVAVKVLRSDLARDPAFLNRFRREAQAAAALNHPAIVAVYDTGEEQVFEPTGGVAHLPYIVMEYVEGHTVRDVLRDGRPLPPDEAVEIVGGVLSALEYSHRAGIVHRDIKPANVMLTTSGAVKVMDFGIARAVADSQATMTQASAVVGTAQYLSPEQARGEQVDARSDLYSTGCLLFELLTGRPPFMADSMVAVAYQHVREEPPRPTSLNPDLARSVGDSMDRIVFKALAKDRETRYQTAGEFRADLEALARGGRIMAPPIGVAGASAMAPSQAATTVMEPMRSVGSAPAWQSTGIMDQPPYGEPPPEEEEEDQRRWWIPVAIGVGVLLLLVVVLFVVSQGGGGDKVAVPNVIGMTAAEAEEALTHAGFVPVPELEFNEKYPEGEVFDQDPKPDSQQRTGVAVKYYVSKGPESPVDGVEVPDVSGKSSSEAAAALAAVGLSVGDTFTEHHGQIGKDKVTRTDPEVGDKVKEGSKVDLYISDGQVQIPSNLEGMTQQQAHKALTDLGLSPSFTTEDAPEAPGTVISSRPGPGEVVPQRSVVNVVIAGDGGDLADAVVPNDVRGKSPGSVENQLRNLGFTNVHQSSVYDDTVPAGQVVSVTPPGRQPLDTPLSVNVSRGREEPDGG